MVCERTSGPIINIESSQRETLERFANAQDVFIFQPQCMNLWVPKRQITTDSTKSEIKLNVELKRQNSQPDRSIAFYKDRDTSLWRSQAKLFF